jgi:hypothetical protein
MDRLSIELGYSGDEEAPGADSYFGADGPVPMALLEAEDEALVAGMRRGLARIAAALDSGKRTDVTQMAVFAALEGAEMVMRGELLRGHAARLPGLMPKLRLPGGPADRPPGRSLRPVPASL